MRSEVVSPKRLLHSLRGRQRDERLGRGLVIVPVFLVARADALAVEGEGRIPIRNRKLIGYARQRRRQVRIVDSTSERQDRGQP